jgi:hypothetical protein
MAPSGVLMILRVLIPVIALLLSPFVVPAQQSRQINRPPLPNPDSSSGERGAQDIDLPDEMRVRLLIERLEGEHKKFIEDVMKLDEMSSEITRSYNERRLLMPEDIKKLGSIEKLAKRILSHAGGSQVDGKKGESAQLSISEAIEKMNVAVAAIKKSALSETRHVVSAAVIGNSNEVIELTRAIRRSQRQKD